MPLSIANNLTNYTLAAGEPFVVEIQLLDSAGRGTDIADTAMYLSFYEGSTRALVLDYNGARAQYQGERLADETGEFFRFAFDGFFSEGMYNKPGVKVELSRRFLNGRQVIATGNLAVLASASSLPSLIGEGIADTAIRVTIKANATLGGVPTITQQVLSFNAGATPIPDPVPVFTTAPSITGTPRVGQPLSSLTFTDGVVSNGAISDRSYLLAGTPQQLSYVLLSSDLGKQLTFRNDATGSGGPANATSLPVTVAAALTLGALTLSDGSFVRGTAKTVNILGSTSGSALSGNSLPAGFSVNSAARTLSYTGAGSGAASANLSLVETLAGATNTPRTSTPAITIAAAGIVLNALSLDDSSFQRGVPKTVNITGATAGSTITGTNLSSVFSINNAARTLYWTGSGAGADSFSLSLDEALSGATNTPRNSQVPVTIAAGTSTPAPTPTPTSAKPPAPVIARDGAAGSTPFGITIVNNPAYYGGMYWNAQRATSAANLTAGTLNGEAIQQVQEADLYGTPVTFTNLGSTPSGPLAFRLRIGVDDGTDGYVWSDWSNVLTDTIAVSYTGTLDPNKVTNEGVLSADKRTLTSKDFGYDSPARAVSTTTLTAPIGYFETTFVKSYTTSGRRDPRAGLVASTWNKNTDGLAVQHDQAGSLFVNDTSGNLQFIGNYGGSMPLGTVVGWLVHKASGRFWLRTPAGWGPGTPSFDANGNITGDPGIPSNLTSFLAILAVDGGDQMRINLGQDAPTYTLPTNVPKGFA